MNILRQSIEKLSSVCDGAQSRDSVGFNGVDSSFMKSVRQQEKWSVKQTKAVYKSLKKYKKQLLQHGIDYDSIVIDDFISDKSGFEMDSTSFIDKVMNLDFSPPRKVNTKNGEFNVSTCEVPNWFWDGYKIYRDELKDIGFSISKFSGDWEITKWESLNDVEVKAKASKASKAPKVNLKNENLLLNYQIPHVKHLINCVLTHNAAVDASATGTGKTYSSLAVAKELGLFPIIITVKSVKHSFEKVMKNHFKMDGFVSNYEQFKFGKTPYFDKKTWDLPENSIVIIDECHRAKSYKTQNAKMLLALKETGVPTLLLSATIGSSPLDLFAIGTNLGWFPRKQDFFRFLYAHGCRKGPWGGFEFDGRKKNLEKINEKLYPSFGGRLRISDLKEFPETLVIPDLIDFGKDSKKIKKIYQDLSEELKTLDSKKSVHHLALMQKARQKAELVKAPLLAEMALDAVEEGQSVAIFVNFNDSVKVLSEILKTDCLVWGSNAAGEREINIEKFQNDQERIIICNIAAGGVGVSLHDLNGDFPRLSLISPDWSAQNLKQVLGRVHRAGGKTKSIQKIVYAADTIEEGVCEAVQNKINQIDVLNDKEISLEQFFDNKGK